MSIHQIFKGLLFLDGHPGVIDPPTDQQEFAPRYGNRNVSQRLFGGGAAANTLPENTLAPCSASCG